MDQSMMVRTDHAKILRAVILHLGDGLNVMNLKDGECGRSIIPFICSRLSGVTTLNLALRSHQTEHGLSQAGRANQPLVCCPSA